MVVRKMLVSHTVILFRYFKPMRYGDNKSTPASAISPSLPPIKSSPGLLVFIKPCGITKEFMV